MCDEWWQQQALGIEEEWNGEAEQRVLAGEGEYMATLKYYNNYNLSFASLASLFSLLYTVGQIWACARMS